MDNKEIYNEYILGLNSSDFGRYIMLCVDMRYTKNSIKRKNIEKAIKSKNTQTKIFLRNLRDRNMIDETTKNEIKLKFNILTHFGAELKIEKINLDFEKDTRSILKFGQIMKIVTFMMLEGRTRLSKQDMKIILDITDSKTIKNIKNIKYDNELIIKDDINSIKHMILKYDFGVKEKYNCIYRFLDKYGHVMYVGSTKKFKNRMNSHFGKTPHLPSELYKNINKVEYCSFGDNSSDMYLYEIYYINKYQPKYNTKDKGEDLTIELPDVNWEDFNFEHLIR